MTSPSPYISERTHAQFVQVLQMLVEQGRQSNQREISLHDPSGAVLATLVLHIDRPKRPKDMPRHLRPKRKLSKRQRVAAKRQKAREPVAA